MTHDLAARIHANEYAADAMEEVFRAWEAAIPPPKMMTISGVSGFRYVEQLREQAIMLKLARVLSGIRAACALCRLGFVQEVGVLQRTLDDVNEDLTFLVAAMFTSSTDPIVERFLSEFFREEVEVDEQGVKAIRKKNLQRNEIREFIQDALGQGMDREAVISTFKTISAVYSGYIHAAATHIMDLCRGDPPKFDLRGTSDPLLASAHAQDFGNVVYRAICSFQGAAKVFGDAKRLEGLNRLSKIFSETKGPFY